MATYSIKNLKFSYPEQERLVLDNINLDIKKGEFVVLCGTSGCGKTTLLRHLKTILTPHGSRSGEIYFEGKKLEELGQREQASGIGFVMQSPDNQIVTDKVWHELAFGLESLGYDTPTIRLRVAEMASFFGIQNWFYKDVNELSGGQKQLLNLASIMAMQPSVLILDEPTSQLDPIAASDFLETINRINEELGTTIILTEHRLEEAFPMADRTLVMEDGKIIADGRPKEVGQQMSSMNNKMFLAMPVPMRVHSSLGSDLECPITVREGRDWLDEYIEKEEIILDKDLKEEKSESIRSNETVVELDEVWFKYEKDLPDVVKGASLEVKKGEFLAVLGGNGTGKTTMLSLISGLNTPYRGKVKIKGTPLEEISNKDRYDGLLGVLPQDPQTLFVKNTLEEDLYEMLKDQDISSEEKEYKISLVVYLCNLEKQLKQHPYDLSGGEQQRAALAKILLLEPEIMLMDEPTKGMDAEYKVEFSKIIRRLKDEGVTIIMVSHDIEFCSEYADRCTLFFDGGIVTEGSPREFFSGNSFYTTAANRMSRHLLKEAVTDKDIIKACGGEIEEDSDDLDMDKIKKELKRIKLEKEKAKKKENKYKKPIIGGISFIIAMITGWKGFPIISSFVWAGFTGNFSEIGFSSQKEQYQYTALLLIFIASITTFILTMFEKGERPPESEIQVDVNKRQLSKRTIISSVLILVTIPLTIFIGVYYLQDRKYYFISLVILLQIMLPFFLVFEDRKPQARELVIIAVLCALGVAGRAAFFMLPQFKPIAAIVIVSGVAFGGESGFLVGALTMLLSNIMYGQGPWTPWQMFSMGIIGFLAGVLFRKGWLRRDKYSLAIYGGLSVFIIYGGIMNPASVIMFQSKITWPMIVTSWVTGVPFDLVHAGATVFFLLIMGEEMLAKLDRIKVKYGLIE